MSELKPYPSYKDSGVEWLGEVPEGWEVKRLKNICAINTDKLSDRASPSYEIEYLDISSVDSVGRIIKTEPMFFDDAPSRARRKVQEGDTVISTVRTYLKAIAYMEKSAENLIVSTGFAVLRADAGVDTKYLNRLVQSPEFVERVVANSEGVAYPAINPTELAALPVWLPPYSEQRTIAAFLDRETSKIDSLIAKKERLIDLLEEKRTALISHAVTKGLDLDAPMKDSGVEWLGEVPEGWEVEPLKYRIRFINGAAFKPTEWKTTGIPIIRIENLNGGEEFNYTTREVDQKYHVHKEDLLFGWSGNRGTSFGPFLWKKDGLYYLNQHIFRLADFDCNKQWLYWMLKGVTAYVEKRAHGIIGLVHITKGELGGIKIPKISKDEQRTIAAFLDCETAKIDKLVGKIREHTEKLKEYRTALISAAVTGKIDVRGES